MLTDLCFNLSIGHIAGTSMSLTVKINGQNDQLIKNFDGETYGLKITVDLPAVIHFYLGNRHPDDTKIDSKGSIIADKFIHLQSLEIFNTLIQSHNLDTGILDYRNNDGLVISPNFFWNQNGIATFTISESDPVIWLIKNNKIW